MDRLETPQQMLEFVEERLHSTQSDSGIAESDEEDCDSSEDAESGGEDLEQA